MFVDSINVFDCRLSGVCYMGSFVLLFNLAVEMQMHTTNTFQN